MVCSTYSPACCYVCSSSWCCITLLTPDVLLRDFGSCHWAVAFESDIDTWMNYILNTSKYKANYKKGSTGYATDVTIQQVNKEGLPVYGIRLVNAYPTQMGELSLDNSVENGIHELSIGWSYDYYVQEDALTSTLGGVGRAIGGLLS